MEAALLRLFCKKKLRVNQSDPPMAMVGGKPKKNAVSERKRSLRKTAPIVSPIRAVQRSDAENYQAL